MSHRRPSRPTPTTRRSKSDARRRQILSAAASPRVLAESLECRRLLTTLSNFGQIDPQTGTAAVGQFFFTDGSPGQSANAGAVIYYRNVTFEVIGAHRGTSTAPAATLSDLAPFPLPTGGTDSGTDIFKIYVTQSSADSYIAISEFSLPVNSPMVLTPYSGTIGQVGTNDAAGRPRASLPSSGGGILVGGVFFGPGVTAARPDLTTSLPYTTPIGLQPVQADGQLTAGIEVIPTNAVTGAQNDFGNMVIAGVVTGNVSFGGNLNEFYASDIFTGLSGGGTLFGNADLQGQFDQVGRFVTGTSDRPSPGNFAVAGDLRELVVAGFIGTDAGVLPSDEGNPRNDPAYYNYESNFDLVVGGNLGELHAGSTVAGTIEVANDPSISGQLTGGTITGNRRDTTEVEVVTPVTAADASAFQQIGLQNNVPNYFSVGQVNLTNNTAADAQILGTFTRTDPNTGLPLRDSNGVILTQASVDGTLTPTAGDSNDFYGMAMMGGQTYQLLLTGGATLVVYDPDGRIIQSNVEANGGAIQVKADRPGVYKFQVTSTSALAYNLTITGTGNLGAGGIVVGGSYNDLGIDGGIAIYRGDLGAITVGDTYYSLTNGPTITASTDFAPSYAPSSIIVANGDLRALVAGNLGETSLAGFFYSGVAVGGNDPLILNFGPVLNIPAGGVGLVQTTGLMNLNTQFDPNNLTLTSDTYKTNTTYARAISGSIQVIDAGTTFQGWLGVDGTIGTLRAGNMSTDLPSQIQVNVDNIGNDGIIDLIDVTGQLGNLAAGGPILRTNTNGDVRYLKVGGSVYLPSTNPSFGGVRDVPTTEAIGQAATFTDDGGTVVTVKPYGVSTTTVVTGTAATQTVTDFSGTTTTSIVNGVQTTTFSPGPGQQSTYVIDAQGNATLTSVIGPQVSVFGYPVADKGGLIPIMISVANGPSATNASRIDSASAVITAVGANGAGSRVDIGAITIAGLGRVLVQTGTDQFGNIKVTQPIPATATTVPTVSGTSNTSTGVTATGTSTVPAIFAGTVTKTTNVISAGNIDPTDLFLILNGPATINVLNTYSVSSIGAFVGAGATGLTTPYTSISASSGTPVLIANQTAGEMVSVLVPAIGTLQAKGNIGFATPIATPAAVLPREVVANDGYPFVQQHTGVSITGSTAPQQTPDAVNINSQSSLGNIYAVTTTGTAGTIGSIVADYGNRPAPGVFAGIVGPIEAGTLLYVQVGQGLTDTGTGAVGFSGLFATNKIGVVTNAGVPNGDIRGNIIALNETNTTNSALDAIQLANASIINTQILDLDGTAYGTTPLSWRPVAFQAGADVGASPLVLQRVSGIPINGGKSSQYDISQINIRGAGGILSTLIAAGSIGPVTIGPGGFGFIDSDLSALSGARIAGITAAGYGIRGSTIDNGGYVGPITATGNGSSLPVTAFSLDLRPSDVGGTLYDPYTGNPLSSLNDLNAALGGSVSAATPNVANVTDTGVIEDLVVSALYDVTGLSAQKLRTALPVNSTSVTPQPAQANIPIIGSAFANSITTGGKVGYVRVRSLIDGFQITAGSIGQFTQSGNVNRLGIDVAGSIGAMTIRGNLGAIITDPATLTPVRDSYVWANGTSSSIGSLTILGNLYADVFVSKYVGSIDVRGNLSGNVTIQGTSSKHLGLTSLKVGGSIASGSLNVAGTVGTIQTGGSLGVAGQALTIAGSVNKLIVGSAKTSATSALALDLTVSGNLGSAVINGQITGAVHVLGNVNSLNVLGNAANANAITGAITVDGSLLSAMVRNGNVAANITAANDIGTFTINRGSLAAGVALTSTLGSIKTVRVTGGTAYGINGSILAAVGNNLNVSTTGGIGDGVNALQISALSGGTIQVGTNVAANAVIAIAGELNNLIVNGSVQAGATISGHPIKHSAIRGTNAGTVTTA